MKYGDFSSLVQLGVGLHVGTALLQLYGDLGMQPLMRRLGRIQKVIGKMATPPPEVVEEFDDLDIRLEIFRIELFNQFMRYMKVNSAVAVALAAALILISYLNEDAVPLWLSILFVVLSLAPGPITVIVLWRVGMRKLRPMEERAKALENRVVRV